LEGNAPIKTKKDIYNSCGVCRLLIEKNMMRN